MSVNVFKEIKKDFEISRSETAELKEKIRLETEAKKEKIKIETAEKIKKIRDNKKVYDLEAEIAQGLEFFNKKSVRIILKVILWILMAAILSLAFFYFAFLYLIIGILIIYTLVRFFY